MVLVGGDDRYYHTRYAGCSRLDGDGVSLAHMSLGAARRLGLTLCPGCAKPHANRRQQQQPSAAPRPEVPPSSSEHALHGALLSRIQTMRANRHSYLSPLEKRCMPWLSDERVPSSWQEFAAGLFLAVAKRGQLYQKQAKVIHLVAIRYGVAATPRAQGRVYTPAEGPVLWVGKVAGAWVARAL